MKRIYSFKRANGRVSAHTKLFFVFLLVVYFFNIRVLYGALTIRYRMGIYSTSQSPSLATEMANNNPCRIGVFLPLMGLKPVRHSNITNDCNGRRKIENLAIQGWRLIAEVLQMPTESLFELDIYGLVDNPSYCDPAWKKVGGPQFACMTLPTRCLHPQYANIPTIDCILSTMSEVGKSRDYDLVVFANGDLLFPPVEFATSMQSIVLHDNNGVVLVGQRTDTTWQEFLGQNGARELASGQLLSLESYKTLTERATMPGHGAARHPDFGIDYFIISTSIIPTNFPPFLVGRFRWDNALLATFLVHEEDVKVVDATDVLPVLHLGDPYSSEAWYHDDRLGADHNDAIAQENFGSWYTIGRIRNARWHLKRKFLGDGSEFESVIQPRPPLERPDHNILIAISRAEGGPLLLIGVLPRELAHALDWAQAASQNTQKSWFHAHFIFVVLDQETYDALETAAPGRVMLETMTGWPRAPTALGWKSFGQIVELQVMSVAIVTASQLHEMIKRYVDFDTYFDEISSCGAVMLQESHELFSINPHRKSGLGLWRLVKERVTEEIGAERGLCWV